MSVAVHAHKPSTTCSLHMQGVASFEPAAAGHAALPEHKRCDTLDLTATGAKVTKT